MGPIIRRSPHALYTEAAPQTQKRGATPLAPGGGGRSARRRATACAHAGERHGAELLELRRSVAHAVRPRARGAAPWPQHPPRARTMAQTCAGGALDRDQFAPRARAAVRQSCPAAAAAAAHARSQNRVPVAAGSATDRARRRVARVGQKKRAGAPRGRRRTQLRSPTALHQSSSRHGTRGGRTCVAGGAAPSSRAARRGARARDGGRRASEQVNLL